MMNKALVKTEPLAKNLKLLSSRLVPIMLLKLLIMLYSNTAEFCLSCSIYAPYVKHYALQIQHFVSLIVLKLENHEY